MCKIGGVIRKGGDVSAVVGDARLSHVVVRTLNPHKPIAV